MRANDKKRDKKAKRSEPKTRRVEIQFSRQLRKVAKEIGRIVSTYGNLDLEELPGMTKVLRAYSEIIKPWAKAVSARMIEEVAFRDTKMWQEQANVMGIELRREIATAPTGAAMQAKLAECVDLITSLPTVAAKRVHDLTMEGIVNGTRAKEIAAKILETGDVTVARATLIARTEVARTASLLTQVRAEHIGSKGYIWRTADDSDVRESHRKMEGVYVDWATPPTLSDGTTTHAGQIYNCRCWPEPVIPDEFD